MWLKLVLLFFYSSFNSTFVNSTQSDWAQFQVQLEKEKLSVSNNEYKYHFELYCKADEHTPIFEGVIFIGKDKTKTKMVKIEKCPEKIFFISTSTYKLTTQFNKFKKKLIQVNKPKKSPPFFCKSQNQNASNYIIRYNFEQNIFICEEHARQHSIGELDAKRNQNGMDIESSTDKDFEGNKSSAGGGVKEWTPAEAYQSNESSKENLLIDYDNDGDDDDKQDWSPGSAAAYKSVKRKKNKRIHRGRKNKKQRFSAVDSTDHSEEEEREQDNDNELEKKEDGNLEKQFSTWTVKKVRGWTKENDKMGTDSSGKGKSSVHNNAIGQSTTVTESVAEWNGEDDANEMDKGNYSTKGANSNQFREDKDGEGSSNAEILNQKNKLEERKLINQEINDAGNAFGKLDLTDNTEKKTGENGGILRLFGQNIKV